MWQTSECLFYNVFKEILTTFASVKLRALENVAQFEANRVRFGIRSRVSLFFDFSNQINNGGLDVLWHGAKYRRRF